MNGSYGGSELSRIITLEANHGYGVYVGTNYTQASPLVVTAGQRVPLLNNAVSGDRSQLPKDGSDFYDGLTNKLISDTIGDEYTIRINFKAFTSSNTGYGEIDVDIGLVDPILVLPVNFPRGSGAGNTRPQTLDSKYFTAATFVANGGDLYYESIRGTTTIYDLSYYISRIHKGR